MHWAFCPRQQKYHSAASSASPMITISTENTATKASSSQILLSGAWGVVVVVVGVVVVRELICTVPVEEREGVPKSLQRTCNQLEKNPRDAIGDGV